MALAHFRMLIHAFLNKDPDIVPEEASLIILDSKSSMYIAKNGRDTKHTRHIARRMHFVRNGGKFNMHNFYWCEVGLQLADIGTKNVSEPDLTPRMMRMLIHELLNKDPDIFPEEASLILLDIKSAVCMAKNGKDIEHTRHIARRMYLVRNGEKCVWYPYHY